MSKHFEDEAFWERAWINHLEAYLAYPPRCGFWVSAYIPWRGRDILEIAGGSCRDSRYLASLGGVGKVIGSDFDAKTIAYLERRFPGHRLKLKREDAFRFRLNDQSFDITFHNGFYVCFSDNEVIIKLLREQARVTREYMVILVHNGENAGLVADFAEKAKTDDLYKIRLFRRAEIEELVSKAGLPIRSLSLFKFGGAADGLLQSHFGRLPNVLRRYAPAVLPRLYAFQSWSKTERIAVVVELDR